jgi:hypothetical protein
MPSAIQSTDVSSLFWKWNFSHIHSPPPDRRDFQNVSDAVSAEGQTFGLRDVIEMMTSSPSVCVADTVTGLPCVWVGE